MYQIVDHVVDLPANVIADVLQHLLVIETRPLTFSQKAELQNLARRRVWQRVVVADRSTRHFDPGTKEGWTGDAMVVDWAGWTKKIELLWAPPCRIQLLSVYVPYRASACLLDPKWKAFLEKHVGELSLSVETQCWHEPLTGVLARFDVLTTQSAQDGGEIDFEYMARETLRQSILPHLPAVPRLKHLAIDHHGDDDESPFDWEQYIVFPEGLQLFRFFTTEEDPTGYWMLKLPKRLESLTLKKLLGWVDWDPEYLPRLPARLKTLRLLDASTGTKPGPLDGRLPAMLPQGLQEFHLGSGGPELKFPAPASVIASLPPGLKHNLVDLGVEN